MNSAPIASVLVELMRLLTLDPVEPYAFCTAPRDDHALEGALRSALTGHTRGPGIRSPDCSKKSMIAAARSGAEVFFVLRSEGPQARVEAWQADPGIWSTDSAPRLIAVRFHGAGGGMRLGAPVLLERLPGPALATEACLDAKGAEHVFVLGRDEVLDLTANNRLELEPLGQSVIKVRSGLGRLRCGVEPGRLWVAQADFEQGGELAFGEHMEWVGFVSGLPMARRADELIVARNNPGTNLLDSHVFVRRRDRLRGLVWRPFFDIVEGAGSFWMVDETHRVVRVDGTRLVETPLHSGRGLRVRKLGRDTFAVGSIHQAGEPEAVHLWDIEGPLLGRTPMPDPVRDITWSTQGLIVLLDGLDPRLVRVPLETRP
ncbi:MAG: hypothetical protein ACFB9M_20980 [Myxococcota bacterium]